MTKTWLRCAIILSWHALERRANASAMVAIYTSSLDRTSFWVTTIRAAAFNSRCNLLVVAFGRKPTATIDAMLNDDDDDNARSVPEACLWSELKVTVKPTTDYSCNSASTPCFANADYIVLFAAQRYRHDRLASVWRMCVTDPHNRLSLCTHHW